MATATQPFTGTYDIDPVHSTVQFAVTHLTVSTFRASFADVDGTTRGRRRRDRARGAGARRIDLDRRAGGVPRARRPRLGLLRRRRASRRSRFARPPWS